MCMENNFIYILISDSKGKMRRNASDQILLNLLSIDIEKKKTREIK